MNDILKSQPIPDGYTEYCGPFKSTLHKANSFGSLLNDPDPYNKLGRLPMPGSNLDQARIMAPTAFFGSRKKRRSDKHLMCSRDLKKHKNKRLSKKYRKSKKKIEKLKSKNKILKHSVHRAKKSLKKLIKHSRVRGEKVVKKKSKHLFGSTPGTANWSQEWNHTMYPDKILNPILENYGNANAPMQYSNNQLNDPRVLAFGSKKKAKLSGLSKDKPTKDKPTKDKPTKESKYKPKTLSKDKPKKESFIHKIVSKFKKLTTKSNDKLKKKSNKPRPKLSSKKSSFGVNENTVGYGPGINLYNEAATTDNFQTGRSFTNDILGRDIGSVQPDGMTPGAWLTNSKGLNFGKVQTAMGSDAGSGHISLESPTFKNLGGKTISLNNGNISIS